MSIAQLASCSCCVLCNTPPDTTSQLLKLALINSFLPHISATPHLCAERRRPPHTQHAFFNVHGHGQRRPLKLWPGHDRVVRRLLLHQGHARAHSPSAANGRGLGLGPPCFARQSVHTLQAGLIELQIIGRLSTRTMRRAFAGASQLALYHAHHRISIALQQTLFV